MKKILLTFTTFLFSIVATAQEGFTLGVKGGVVLGTPNAITNIYVIDLPNELRLERPSFNRSAGQIGLIGRYDFEKSYVYSEASYTKIYTQAYVTAPSLGFGVAPPERQLTTEIGGGIKVLSKIRLYAGLGAGILVGNAYDKETRHYHEDVQRRLLAFPENDNLADNARNQTVEKAFAEAPNRMHLTGKVGIGFDAGGAMIDLSYQRSLTPYLTDIQYNNQTYDSKLNYGLVSLSVAYRILPINKFLTAPRKNKAFKAEKAAIPFYKNEYSLVFGKEGEDINSMNVYENTYTRYIVPRFGVTVGLSAMTESLQSINDDGVQSNPSLDRMFSGFVEAKFLPVYALKHRVGISGGLNVIKRKGVYIFSSGSSFINNQFVTNYGFEPLNESATLGYQTTVDYKYLITKKLGIGVWMRVNGEGFENSFAQFGLKTSVLF